MPLLTALLALVLPAGQAVDVDLAPLQDSRTPLANPHKGWYHHFPDNHPDKYRIARDEDLLEFPGMDHLYIRLAWAYLEPEEGRFAWEAIDGLIAKWTAKGLGIAFRISCKETSVDRPEQQYATPRWVKEAGAKGGHYRMGKETGPEGPWEPVWDDPVFLAKLERFLDAFAARYDGKPWLRYVDVGSLGDWGEGHSWAGSRKECGPEARRRHVDLHVARFRKTPLLVSDDLVHASGGAAEREALHRRVLAAGIGYRDDSILVDGYLAGTSGTFTVRSPGFFADAYPKVPTVLELEHYGHVKRLGNWDGRPGSNVAKFGRGRKGPDYLRGALELLHATYIGYHGDAREWLTDNPELTGELLNRCGYWYFLKRLQTAAPRAGQDVDLGLTWENRGVAPAYHDFRLQVRWEGPEPAEQEVDARNRGWAPGAASAETYRLRAPSKPGRYVLKLRLHSPAAGREVRMGIDPARRDASGFVRVAELPVGD